MAKAPKLPKASKVVADDAAFLHYTERPETNIIMCPVDGMYSHQVSNLFLTSSSLADVDDVRKYFGNKRPNGATAVVLVPQRSSCSWYITMYVDLFVYFDLRSHLVTALPEPLPL